MDPMEHPSRTVPIEPSPGVVELSVPSEASFEEFFVAERGRLLEALIVNRAEAEELLQDAFVKVWERWERVSAMESPAGFLYRVSMNLYRSRLRRASVAL